MKRVSLFCLLAMSSFCKAMEPGSVTLDLEEGADYAPLNPKIWAEQAVTCIIKDKSSKLQALLANPPAVRTNKTPTDYLIEQLNAEKQQHQNALNSSAWRGKKLQNKLWAIFIDLGLPITGGAFGLTEGIIAKEELLIFFGGYFLVSSAISGIRQAYDHWTMADYEDKITALDINLLLLQHTQHSNQKGTNSSGDREKELVEL